MEIKLFTADVAALKDPLLFRALYTSVSAPRREKIDRIQAQKGRLLSLGAGALLEAALAELGIRSPRLILKANGKPYLADRNDVFFNLSHSGTKVLCALSDHEIGCDVEQRRSAKLPLARRCFCAEEYQAILNERDSAARDRLFYRFWTLKESFLKVTGLGLQLPLNAFQIRIAEDRITVEQSVDTRHYAFCSFSTDDYEYALCSADRIPEGVKLTLRSFPSLLDVLSGSKLP